MDQHTLENFLKDNSNLKDEVNKECEQNAARVICNGLINSTLKSIIDKPSKINGFGTRTILPLVYLEIA